jgi:chromosome segregation ATPase
MDKVAAVAAELDWDDAELAEEERAFGRRREILLAVLASALLILVGVGGVYFINLLDQREATILALYSRIANLETANTSLSKEVSDLGAERSQLLATRETLTRERDGLMSERTSLVAERAKMAEQLGAVAATRDRVAAERDRLNGRLSDLDRQLVEMSGKLDTVEQDVSSARLESARQTERAKAAESQSQLNGQIVKLDNDLSREAGVFISLFDQLGDAYNLGDPVAFSTAYSKCVSSAARLDSLRRQRDRLVAQLSG